MKFCAADRRTNGQTDRYTERYRRTANDNGIVIELPVSTMSFDIRLENVHFTNKVYDETIHFVKMQTNFRSFRKINETFPGNFEKKYENSSVITFGASIILFFFSLAHSNVCSSANSAIFTSHLHKTSTKLK